MKTQNRKGFTIVELIIVIAIIAVLAAVLIPTFGNLIKKANDSAYEQERTNQKIQDAVEKIENTRWLTWEEFEAKLAEELSKLKVQSGESELTKDQLMDAVKTALLEYIGKEGDKETGLTEKQVEAIIERALSNQLTTAQVEAIVNAAINGITLPDGISEDSVKAIVEKAISKIPKQTGVTAEEMKAAIESAVNELKTTLTDENGDPLTEEQVSAIIGEALANALEVYKQDSLDTDEVKALIELLISSESEANKVAAAKLKNDIAAGLTNVKLLTNVTLVDEGLTISNGSNINFDLNGHSLVQIIDTGTTSSLIKNNGTLVLNDSTDVNKNGEGKGSMIVYCLDPDPADIPSYATNVISNYGNITINGGYYENKLLSDNGYATFVLDNYSGGTATINGGHFVQKASYTYAVRMFLNSTTNSNTLTVNGGTIEGGYALWMQYANGNANKASLTINGGTFIANDGLSVYAGAAGSNDRNATNIDIAISGGDIRGTGCWIGSNTAFNSFSVTGGKFVDFGVSAVGGSKFVTGGTFGSNGIYFTNTRDDSTPLIADGYVAHDNGNGTFTVVAQ